MPQIKQKKLIADRHSAVVERGFSAQNLIYTSHSGVQSYCSYLISRSTYRLFLVALTVWSALQPQGALFFPHFIIILQNFQVSPPPLQFALCTSQNTGELHLWIDGITCQRRIQAMEMRCYASPTKIMLPTRQSVPRSSRHLLTTLKRRKLQCYGHVSSSSGLTKTFLQGTVKGGRRQGRQSKRRKGTREWTGLEFAMSQRAVENGVKMEETGWCTKDPRWENCKGHIKDTKTLSNKFLPKEHKNFVLTHLIMIDEIG